MKGKKEVKVLVCLSGGVDSSVAAHLLVQDGYSVVGAYMKQWSDSKDVAGVCTWKEEWRDAQRVAAHIGIPLITLDFEKEYKDMVVEYMFSEYTKGRTPNPDILCNKWIKFGFWRKKAQELGFDIIATGHYANIKQTKTGTYELRNAKDKNKDQTYFLHQLNQEQLSSTLFPLGEYTKNTIREIAKKAHLPTAEKEESMGICFIGKVSMKDFLQQRIPKCPGNIVTTTGKIIGTHDGVAFYTIGQRHGFAQDGGDDPFFVIKKNTQTQELVVGHKNDPARFVTEQELVEVHYISGQEPEFPLQCKVRTRHRQTLQPCTLFKKNNTHILQFNMPQVSVTPGQFAVLYKNDSCLGGGIIA